MKISPIDIQQQQFKSRPFGYEKAGVDRFLELVAEELERLMRENQDLVEELTRVNDTLAEMRAREETLKQTLVTTQKVTEEMKANARREADVLMAEAEVKAERLLQNAEERRLQLIEEIQEIKRQKVDFEVSLRGLLEKHIRLMGLNDVAIAHQDADAQLLEEPLPFSRQRTSAGEPENDRQEHDSMSRNGIEDAEYDETEKQTGGGVKEEESPADPEVPELSFDFDPNNGEDEEDLLK